MYITVVEIELQLLLCKYRNCRKGALCVSYRYTIWKVILEAGYNANSKRAALDPESASMLCFSGELAIHTCIIRIVYDPITMFTRHNYIC